MEMQTVRDCEENTPHMLLPEALVYAIQQWQHQPLLLVERFSSAAEPLG